MLDADVLAGVDVDAVAVAGVAADGEAFDQDVAAVGGMDVPDVLIGGRKILEVHAVAAQELDECGVAIAGFAGEDRAAGAASEPGIALDVARSNNADAGGVDGVVF